MIIWGEGDLKYYIIIMILKMNREKENILEL